VKDFLPYAAKIKASGADAVLTGNWGNDLTLLIKAAREAGVDASFYTFYGNALGAPAAIGEAGVGRLLAVAEWHPNVGTASSERFYAEFRQRFPNPARRLRARAHAGDGRDARCGDREGRQRRRAGGRACARRHAAEPASAGRRSRGARCARPTTSSSSPCT
jgi:hypothetical protein